jgi:hypothetical protein
MKSFIFSMIKSVQENCVTFSCRLCAGLSSFFWTNLFTKKLIFYGALLLFGLGFMPNSYSQLVGGAAVKANFGVEADAHANLLQFGNLGGPPNTDDWFNHVYPGTGRGVIDETNAAARRTSILANNNFSFSERQVVFPLDPINYPNVPFPVVDGYLWIDAVYGRDTNSAQGNSDSSIFTSTSDKNPDNPITWNLGSGSVPQKDDIIDAMAHLRGIGPHDPTTNPGFPADDRPFNELWAFASATLRATSGSKHIDFEFYRTIVTYNSGDLHFGNTGPDGGRTAWTFDADGDIVVPGGIIVSVDYENGGVNPDVRIRVWMDEAVFNGLNAKANRPFDVIAGTFEKGELTGNFGYGRINLKAGDTSTNIFGRVNEEAATLGPPWGTLEGPNAAFFDNYQPFQHVEIGINLTAFGLDRRGTSDPCSNILGSILVKTRSCAGGNNDPFTCEQKDFAGPFPFGFTVHPDVDLAVDRVITCTNPSATITASNVIPPGSTLAFYGPDPTPLDKTDGIGPLIPADNTEPPQDLDRSIIVGGVYAVVVAPAGFTGCTDTAYVTVLEDKAPPVASCSGTNVSCNGANDGTAGVVASEGTGPYTYLWAPGGGTTANITGLAPGKYTVTVTGANGCTATCDYTVTQPDVVTLATSHTDVSCNGAADGKLKIDSFHGTGTATFYLKTDLGPFVLTDQATIEAGSYGPGTYVIKVTYPDGKNPPGSGVCEKTETETITQPTALVASDGHTDVTCNGGSDGSVTITFSDGTTPYTVSFNGSAFTAQSSPKTYAGLTAGTYPWTVKDDHGCEVSGSEIVGQPTALVASDGHTDASCNGALDGSVTITFSGGTGPYMVNFNGGGFATQTSPKTYSGLAAGSYSWTVKDSHGCEQSGSEIVGTPSAVEASDGHTDVTCNGGSDGSVTVTFSGGTGPYMVNFNGGGFATQTSPKAYSGLAAGTYSWTVKDSHGCETSGSEIVGQPTALVASDGHTDVACNGGSDGSVTITFSGGTGPYMVNFNGGGFATQTSPKTYSGLAAGTYSWTVKDSHGCEQSGSEIVGQPTALVASDGHTDVTCFGGSDGSVTITFSDGTIPYTVSFNGGAFTAQTSPKTYSGLTAGTYSWTVRDDHGCEKSGSEIVGTPTAVVVGAEHTAITCFGGSSTLTVSATGGTGSYTYSIDGTNYQASPTFTVVAGTYTVYAKDANGCIDTDTEIVPEGPSCGYGCTPGFWQGGSGKQLWDSPTDPIAIAVGFTTETQISAVLPGVAGLCEIPTSLKMIDAITLGGGNCRKLIRHGVAAILNATTLAEYPLPTGINDVAGLKAAIIAAVTNNCGCEALATELAANNELNHDLCGTITNDLSNTLISNAALQYSLSESTTAKTNSFKAHPVPFKDQLTVSYDFNYVTDVKIEVFNARGIVVASKYDGQGYLNKEVLLNIPATGQAEVYLVKVTTNRGSSVQKVISSR